MFLLLWVAIFILIALLLNFRGAIMKHTICLLKCVSELWLLSLPSVPDMIQVEPGSLIGLVYLDVSQ